jgi:hypothetical protein
VFVKSFFKFIYLIMTIQCDSYLQCVVSLLNRLSAILESKPCILIGMQGFFFGVNLGKMVGIVSKKEAIILCII